MNGLRFAEPQWVHAIWAVALFVAALFWLDRRGGSALDRLVSPVLRRRLVQRPSTWRRRLRIALLGLAGVCGVLALMRPQWGMRTVATPRVGAEIMICLDVSRSMLAADVAPTRLDRAKAEIADLLTYLDGDQVGLIAFAGRASVLSPLTPDFSFLRLVLDAVGPNSVSRGGTRLEEPIRKAVAGFAAPGEASRAILLITDGEDHDSFPVDAAKDAAKAGIKIIAIGFGDEAGSRITVTDPETGARSLLRDADGRPVVSRLDGDLLREIALATGGAYVPAGTGVLDLESIYDQHIARLTRGRLDPRGRTVRDEQYQWAVLLALAFLVSSVAVSAGPASRVALLAGVVWLGVQPAAPARAADAGAAVVSEPAPSARAPAADAGAGPGEPEPGEKAGAASEGEAETPREVYNRGVAALDGGQVEEAEKLLRRARDESRGDGRLRFQATYDLGIAAVARADGLEEGQPSDALAALYEAADWFRDAVSQRHDDADSRHNLEVVLRRSLLLADRIAQQDDRGLEGALEDLAARERELAGRIAQLVEQLSGDDDPYAADRLRRDFRARATAQRTLLSDADGVAERAAREQEALAARPQEERSPEDSMRLVQLEGVMQHLHRARERMGQAGRQLRRRQAARGYRRSSAALGALKRAQDQLRDPVSFLDQVLVDATQVSMETRLLSMDGRLAPGGDEPVQVPAWISLEGLQEEQGEVGERTVELAARLRAGLDHAGDAELSPQQQEILQAVQAAEPFASQGRDAMVAAGTALGGGDLQTALDEQQRGLIALGEARERFFDLRRLIEAAAVDEARIAAVLGSEEEEAREARAEYLPSLREAQDRNLDRAERIDGKLAAELERLDAALASPDAAQPDPTTGAPPDPDKLRLQRQRFDLATQLLTLALAGMDDAAHALGDDERPARSVAWKDAAAGAAKAKSNLEQLRRLFFTLVEQLRELGEQQVELADATRDAGARAAADPDTLDEAIGPLRPRQGRLAERAGEISGALLQQSDQAGGVVAEADDAKETSERLRLAAEHVVSAQGEMEGAVTQLAAEKPQPAEARTHQDRALEEIGLALALLAPPEQQQPPPQQQPEQPQQQQQGGQQQQDQKQAQGQQPQPDPAQLLQAVRDREAQRRREQAERARHSSETVEKDW